MAEEKDLEQDVEMVNGYIDPNLGGTLQENHQDVEDDPVVHEIPIFLSKSLADNLYLYQYPVRPANMPYDNQEVISAKVKPGQQQIELAVAIKTHDVNYDSSKGEQFALNVDGCKAGSSKLKKTSALLADDSLDDKLYPSGLMDKQTLSSAKSIPDPQGRYAVGILGGNELHITPLAGIISLRPDMKYLDKGDKTARKEGRVIDDPDNPASVSMEAVEEMKPVTVRFAKSDQESVKKLKEKTYEYQQRKAEEEPWIPTRFHHVKSAKWEEESQKLFCKKMNCDIETLNESSCEYLNSLTKEEDQAESDITVKKETPDQ